MAHHLLVDELRRQLRHVNLRFLVQELVDICSNSKEFELGKAMIIGKPDLQNEGPDTERGGLYDESYNFGA
jgi:hypothetical protein